MLLYTTLIQPLFWKKNLYIFNKLIKFIFFGNFFLKIHLYLLSRVCVFHGRNISLKSYEFLREFVALLNT
jgi:hypothetical protein